MKLWVLLCRSCLDRFDSFSFLAVHCGVYFMKVKLWNISYESVGCGAFTDRPFGTGEIGGFYTLILVHSNQTKKKLFQRPYGHSVMSIAVDNVSTWQSKLQETFLDCTGKKRSSLVLLDCFCFMGIIIDKFDLFEDKSTDIDSSTRPWENSR